jgi:hypothetical protein
LPDNAYLTLKRKGRLLFQNYQMERARDVTKTAAYHLYDQCKIESGVTVRDVFALMGKNPRVVDLFSRFCARQLVKEAVTPKKGGASSNLIGEKGSYINISRNLNTFDKSNHFEYWGCLSISLMGPILFEDATEDGAIWQKAGTRISYTTMDLSPANVAHLSVNLDQEQFFWRPFIHAKKGSKQVQAPLSINFGYPALGEIFFAFVRAFSWFGAGEAREKTLGQFVETIKNASICMARKSQ